MLGENDLIITESESVAKIFNKYFNGIAEGIGFNDPIPENFDSDDILLSMIKRYDNHPSIIAIKNAFKDSHLILFMLLRLVQGLVL